MPQIFMTKVGQILWQPSKERISSANITAFFHWLDLHWGLKFQDYDALYKWSISEIDQFWLALAEFSNILWQKKAIKAYEPSQSGRMQDARFFQGARLNFAQNLLRPSQLDPEEDRVIAYAEGRKPLTWKGKDLLQQVQHCATALKSHGVKPGDRVVGVLANVPETLVAMLATAAIGGVWSSCSPDFGESAIIDRFAQLSPKILFFTPAYYYNGKLFSTESAIKTLQEKLGIPTAICVNHLDDLNPQMFERVGVVSWKDFLVTTPSELEFVEREFSDPQYILFSSGTTGIPKGIVHSVGGTLLQHAKELTLHSDIKPLDRLLYYTTCGWMMWNWMASALYCGATLILYEGSPFAESLGGLWQTAIKSRVTHLGVSPKYLAALAQTPLFSRTAPKKVAGSLKTLLSTGSPLSPEQFSWVYDYLDSDLHLASISGGTDIVSCFMLGVPILPVRAGEIQRPGLGMAIEAWDENEKAVIGKKGELVCTKPFVSMPIGFWNDPQGERYHRAYFSHYQSRSVWRHGDFIEVTDHLGIVVHGRSDATLNPGGVRIGTAELYRQLEAIPSLEDFLAIGYETAGDTEIWLFVKLRKDQVLDQELIRRIKEHLRTGLSPRHVPHQIFAVKDIPYTRSGKRVEIAVTEAVHARPIANLSSLANPESIAEYEGIGRNHRKALN